MQQLWVVVWWQKQRSGCLSWSNGLALLWLSVQILDVPLFDSLFGLVVFPEARVNISGKTNDLGFFFSQKKINRIDLFSGNEPLEGTEIETGTKC